MSLTTNLYDNVYNPDLWPLPAGVIPGFFAPGSLPHFAAADDAGGGDAGDDADDDSDELDNVDFDAEDDEDDDTESEDDDNEDEKSKDKDTGPHKGKTRAELEAELKRQQSNTSRARAQQRKWRERALAAEKTSAKAPSPADVAAVKKAQKDDGDEAAKDEGKERGLTRADIDDILREATERAEKSATSRYKPVAVRAAAKNALTDAGLRVGKTAEERDRAFNRAYKLLNMNEIDVDPEDGEVMGLEEQIEELREEWPELFGEDEDEEPVKQVRRRPRINGKSGRAAEPGKQKITASDGQLAHLRGHMST